MGTPSVKTNRESCSKIRHPSGRVYSLILTPSNITCNVDVCQLNVLRFVVLVNNVVAPRVCIASAT